MIVEYHFLLDLNEVFKNKKYIIHVYKDEVADLDVNVNLIANIENFKRELYIKSDAMNTDIVTRLQRNE